MLSERLNKLIDELDTKKTYIASYANINRTVISHIASGKRIPPRDSSSVKKTVDGIYRYAYDNNKLSVIAEIIDVDSNVSESDFKEAIINYLYEDMPVNDIDSRKNRFSDISDKLNLTLTLLDMTNKELSERLHTDASHISRFRTGARSIKTSSAFATRLSTCLWNCINQNQETESISIISGIPKDRLNKDTFTSWLFDSDAPIMEVSDKNIYAKKIIEAFSQSNKKKANTDRSLVLSSRQENIALNFIGKEGLRNAVEHFFAEALASTPPTYFCTLTNRWIG